MSSLANQQQNLSFPGLLQVPGGITSTLQQVQDGNGNPTGLSLSSAGASVTTSSTFQASKNGITLTGALPRLISDGFGDLPTVKDFGAIGNGIIDDTAAFTAAIAASPTGVAVPAGSYKITGTVTGAFYSFGTVTIVTGTITSIQNVTIPYAASTGSTLVGTTYGGAGSVTRTVASKLNDVVCVKDFGAVGDGVTDDTAAMQAAHNTGQLIYYPRGTYLFTSITMSKGGIIGDGPDTLLLQNSITADGITFSNVFFNVGPIFRDFIITAVNEKTAGAFIKVTVTNTASDRLLGTTIQNVFFYQNYFDGLILINQVYYVIDSCRFINYSNVGLTQINSVNADAGDSTITNCIFNTARSTGQRIGYAQNSGGGIRICNNKFLGGNYNIDILLTSNQASADLFIQNNSIEGAQLAAIKFDRASGATGTLGPILIQNNNLGAYYSILCNTSSSVFSEFLISGNNFYQTSNAGFAIFLTRTDNPNIIGNTFNAPGGSTGVVGVYLDANCLYGQITGNSYRRIAVPYNNLSTTTVINEHIQTGSGSATTSSAYGTLYQGSATITFPVPFFAAPTVSSNLIDAASNGGVSILIGTITTTQFNVIVLGNTNAKTLNFTWIANGVICV